MTPARQRRERLPSLDAGRIAAALAAADVTPAIRIRVSQVFTATTSELEGRVASRSLSNLAALPDEEFRAGLAALRRDVAAGRVEQPLVDHLDPVVFAA